MHIEAPIFLEVVLWQANIRSTPFNLKSPRHLEMGVLRLRMYGGGVNAIFSKEKYVGLLSSILSYQANIRNKRSSTRSLQDNRKWVFWAYVHREGGGCQGGVACHMSPVKILQLFTTKA